MMPTAPLVDGHRASGEDDAVGADLHADAAPSRLGVRRGAG